MELFHIIHSGTIKPRWYVAADYMGRATAEGGNEWWKEKEGEGLGKDMWVK
jgi:hypothetical protein